jgi:hypothetical protein
MWERLDHERFGEYSKNRLPVREKIWSIIRQITIPPIRKNILPNFNTSSDAPTNERKACYLIQLVRPFRAKLSILFNYFLGHSDQWDKGAVSNPNRPSCLHATWRRLFNQSRLSEDWPVEERDFTQLTIYLTIFRQLGNDPSLIGVDFRKKRSIRERASSIS